MLKIKNNCTFCKSAAAFNKKTDTVSLSKVPKLLRQSVVLERHFSGWQQSGPRQRGQPAEDILIVIHRGCICWFVLQIWWPHSVKHLHRKNKLKLFPAFVLLLHNIRERRGRGCVRPRWAPTLLSLYDFRHLTGTSRREAITAGSSGASNHDKRVIISLL